MECTAMLLTPLNLTASCELWDFDLTVEFDSWCEDSLRGGVTADGPSAEAGSAANVAAGKPETVSEADKCVCYAFNCSSQ